MEVRGRSRKNKGRVNTGRRIRALMSMVLTAAMLVGNMSASVNTILAATPAPREEFRLHAEAIQKAAEKALNEGTAVTEEILIDGKDKSVVKEYEKMFAVDGKLYELDLNREIETVQRADGIDLRIFMRLPKGADPKTYVLNGEEELYFVYVNYGEESVAARLNIDGLISGFNTIKPYEAVFGEKEILYETETGAGDTDGGADEEAETVNKDEADTKDDTAEREEVLEGAGEETEGEGGSPEEEGEAAAGNEGNGENVALEEIDKSEGNDSTDITNTTEDIDKEAADKTESTGHPTNGESLSTESDDKQEVSDLEPDAGQENSSAASDSEDKGNSSTASDSEDKGNSSAASDSEDKGNSSTASDSEDKGNNSKDADNSDSAGKTESNQESGKSEGKAENSSSDTDNGSGDKAEDKTSDDSQEKEVTLNSLQISFHQILRVAETEGALGTETKAAIEETEEETWEETEEETWEETEEETEETAGEMEEETWEENEEETGEITGETEENPNEEIPETEAGTAETSEAETNEEAIVEVRETEAVSETADEGKEENAVFPVKPEINEIMAEDEEIEAEAEKEDPFKKKGVLEGKILNLVSFEDGLTARAFTTTLGKLGMSKEDLTEGGHILTYTISPVGSAVVVNAPELVRDDSEVIFGVIPQIGYRIAAVMANGEKLETADGSMLASASDAKRVVASSSNGKKGAEYNEEDVVYFILPQVRDSLAVEIVMLEEIKGSHPAFNEEKTINGVTITVSAEEGILPEGTYLSVEEVTDKVADAVKENVEAEEETTINAVMAYDINLMLDGKKLSNAYWNGNYVNVEFSGERIEEIKKNASKIEIGPLETPTKTVNAALGTTEKIADLDGIENKDIQLKEQEVKTIYISEEGNADKIEYQAEHFSIYVIWSNGEPGSSYGKTVSDILVGETMNLQSNDKVSSGIWKSTNPSVVSVEYSGNTATITGRKAGTATIQYGRNVWGSFNVASSYTINVLEDSFDLYCYVLLPNVSLEEADASKVSNDYWNSLAIGKIRGVESPSKYSPGTEFTINGMEIELPAASSLFTNQYAVTVGGKTYYYIENESQIKDSSKNYYTVKWLRVVAADGANAGNNNAITPVENKMTYHGDGKIELIDEEVFNVNFWIQEAGAGEFEFQDKYAKYVRKGTNESVLAKPEPVQEKQVNGITYYFDGWYTDSACTTRTNFDKPITTNMNYYGRYLPYQANVVVQKHLKDWNPTLGASADQVAFALYSADNLWNPIEAIKENWKVNSPGSSEKTDTGKTEEITLLPGNYLLYETTPATGYQDPGRETPIKRISVELVSGPNKKQIESFDCTGGKIKLKNVNGVYQVEVENERIYTAVLPDTGGHGLGLIKEFGWVLLLLALMMAGLEVQYYRERRRKVRADGMRMDV